MEHRSRYHKKNRRGGHSFQLHLTLVAGRWRMPTGDPRAEAKSALIRHLAEKKRSGEDYVWLTPESRSDLIKLGEQNLSTAPPRIQEAPAQITSPSQKFSEVRKSLGERETPAPRPVAPTPPRQTPPNQGVSASSSQKIQPAKATGTSKRERLDSLIAQAEKCPRCHELGTFRETMVFSVGSPDAELMFVGEAPGAEEEVQGEPFVGPAGQLLTKIIGATGLDRSQVYISNICKFRPRLPNQTSNNRAPTAEEIEVSLPFVLAEANIVRPKVIVALGGTALEGLLGAKMSVARARESVHDFHGIPLIVTYHPSYILRNTAISERRKVWEDMMRAMDIAGMPISAKQRGFFRGK